METVGDNVGVYGLYELSDTGTILYSRPRGSEGLHEAIPEVIGRDFFYDVVGCDNREDLRRHFRAFVSGRRPVDAFLFDCLFKRTVVRTKIFMTRALETEEDRANEIVIMDIRKAGQ